MKSMYIGLAAAGILVLAGCGGTSPASQTSGAGGPAATSGAATTSGAASTTGHSPCSLVPTSQIEAINGGSNLTNSTTPNGTTCNWTDPTNSLDTAEIEVLPTSGTPTAAQLQTAMTDALGGASGGNGTPVTGLGSIALKAIATTSASYGFAINGNIVIIAVFSQGNAGSAMDAQVQTLAQSVAGQF